ncbi:hypothetical protein DJ030_13565 [bacterium endosymbiont of Escarpia laminata]|nr:MAG: hypothetical protein DJ030_13565 [bacterium endosymbiont of Escarpia laminata]
MLGENLDLSRLLLWTKNPRRLSGLTLFGIFVLSQLERYAATGRLTGGYIRLERQLRFPMTLDEIDKINLLMDYADLLADEKKQLTAMLLQ